LKSVDRDEAKSKIEGRLEQLDQVEAYMVDALKKTQSKQNHAILNLHQVV